MLNNIILLYYYFSNYADEDLAMTKFKDTKKSFIVRGFVKQEDVPIQYWFGKGCHVVVPDPVT